MRHDHEDDPGQTKHGEACLDEEGYWSGLPTDDDDGWICDVCGEFQPVEEGLLSKDDAVEHAGLNPTKDRGPDQEE